MILMVLATGPALLWDGNHSIVDRLTRGGIWEFEQLDLTHWQAACLAPESYRPSGQRVTDLSVWSGKKMVNLGTDARCLFENHY